VKSVKGSCGDYAYSYLQQEQVALELALARALSGVTVMIDDDVGKGTSPTDSGTAPRICSWNPVIDSEGGRVVLKKGGRDDRGGVTRDREGRAQGHS